MRQIDITQAFDNPTILYDDEGHAVYWLGINEPTAFRTNTYLIHDGDEAILVDPGHRAFFQRVKDRVAQVLPPEHVTGLILCHQDPDVAASMTDWLEINPGMKIYTTPRTQILIQHYGRSDYLYVDVEDKAELVLPSGACLKFIPAPFLHFPGAFTTYDATAHGLFTGDVFSSLGVGVRLWAEDFTELRGNMRLFHTEYMASNIATRGFTRQLDGLDIEILLPQHGCLIGSENVHPAIDWLAQLQCGTDLVYPDLS
ncbi:MAG: MBL fold metallo-hydrolase [Mariprofundaceae bacterium]